MYSKSTLDDYDIGHQIGQGGFSKVYLARDRRQSRSSKVALKLIKKDATSEANCESLRLLQRELRIHSSISGKHPNIIKVLESFDSGSVVCVALEYARTDLRRLVLDRKNSKVREMVLDEIESKFVMCQILAGIAFLHKHGIVHRDIKASNILLVRYPHSTHNQSNVSLVSSTAPSSFGQNRNDIDLEKYRVMISDLGVAVQMDPDDDWECCQETLCGTTCCLAPEIAIALSSSKTVRSRHGLPVDLFSAGCVLFYMLTGYYPFSSADGDQEPTILRRIVEGRWKIPSTMIVSDMLRSVLVKMLSIKPKSRGNAKSLALLPFFASGGREGMTVTISSKDIDKTKNFSTLGSNFSSNIFNKASVTLELYSKDGSEYATVSLVDKSSSLPEVNALFSNGIRINYKTDTGQMTIRKNNEILIKFDINIDSSFGALCLDTQLMDCERSVWTCSHFETAKSILTYQEYIRVVQDASLECIRIIHLDHSSLNGCSKRRVVMKGADRQRWVIYKEDRDH